MKQNNIILERTYEFALIIIQTYVQLKNENEYVLSKQLLRSGTSIGANAEEAIAGQSTRDFISKFSISLKEARESHYWIRLLRDSQLIDTTLAGVLLVKCTEIIKIITAILKTSKLSVR